MDHLLLGRGFHIVAASEFHPRAEHVCTIAISEPANTSLSDALEIMLLFHGRDDSSDIFDWDLFQTALRQFPGLPAISIGFGDDASVRSLLQAVLRLDVFSEVVHANRFSVIKYTQGWKWSDIFSAPEHCTRDKVTVTLTLSERVDWLMRYSVAARELYLDGLFASRSGFESSGGSGHHTQGDVTIVP